MHLTNTVKSPFTILGALAVNEPRAKRPNCRLVAFYAPVVTESIAGKTGEAIGYVTEV